MTVWRKQSGSEENANPSEEMETEVLEEEGIMDEDEDSKISEDESDSESNDELDDQDSPMEDEGHSLSRKRRKTEKKISAKKQNPVVPLKKTSPVENNHQKFKKKKKNK